MHILYLTAEQWPTFRVDLVTLFGKYLPRFGVTCDLVNEQDIKVETAPDWTAGKAILCRVPNNRALQYLIKFFHNVKILLTADYSKYDAVQVRDMTVSALVAIVMCKFHRKPFFYWLSFPQSEGQIDRAKKRGLSGGIRFWFPLIQGNFGKWLVYRLIMPSATHVFVQTQNMLDVVAKQGIPPEKMTPVPMGVDIESSNQQIQPIKHPSLHNKRALVYLGTLDRVRQIEILFSMLSIVKEKIPEVLLILVGDTEDRNHRNWLEDEAKRLSVHSHILWTGWLPMNEAWQYAKVAEIGLSPIPRGYLLDMGSPTKAVEYMALGLPVVMNDNPDQMQVAKGSGAGRCVPLDAQSFSNAVLEILDDSNLQAEMREKGKTYVKKNRSYEQLASMVASKYQTLITQSS